MTEHAQPHCPICGASMRQIRRGATLARNGPCYVCPRDEAEVVRDERGHLRRKPDAIHPPGIRTWHAHELEHTP